MDNLENSFRNKLDDAEMLPPSDMWDRVESRLPKEKKRGLLWVAYVIPALLVGAGIIFYVNQNTNINSNSDQIHADIQTPSLENSPKLAELGQHTPEPTTHQPASSSLLALHPTAAHTEHSQISQRISSIHLPMEYISEPTTWFPMTNRRNIYIKSLPSQIEKPNKVNTKPISFKEKKDAPEPPKDKKNTPEKPCSFVLESVNNIYISDRALKPIGNPGTDKNNYIKLRNGIERGNINFSGGVAFKVCLSKNLMVGTGIRITHYSEDLIYNKTDVSVAFEAPPIGIDEVVKKKYPYTFTKQTDSIYAGPMYYGGTNSYYFRELPITFGYYKYGKQWNFFAEPAISYCRITAIKASLLDLDHVGFTTVNQIDGYQGVSHIFNGSIRVGAGYNLNKSVAFNLGGYFSRAITPLINYGYAKQLPYTYGITLGIEKRL